MWVGCVVAATLDLAGIVARFRFADDAKGE